MVHEGSGHSLITSIGLTDHHPFQEGIFDDNFELPILVSHLSDDGVASLVSHGWVEEGEEGNFRSRRPISVVAKNQRERRRSEREKSRVQLVYHVAPSHMT